MSALRRNSQKLVTKASFLRKAWRGRYVTSLVGDMSLPSPSDIIEKKRVSPDFFFEMMDDWKLELMRWS